MLQFKPSTICLLCAETSLTAPICNTCQRLFIPLNKCNQCQCGAIRYDERALCLLCQQQKPVFQAAFTGYRYCYPLDRLLIHYKHLRQHQTEPALKQLWLQHIQSISPLPEALVPIPLHYRRYWRRGFNQAVQLAKFAAELHNIPSVPLLQKYQYTHSQQGKTRIERKHNIEGSFACPTPFKYQHLALVDDVLTTGSTANEAARVLIANGAQRVDIWALAQAF